MEAPKWSSRYGTSDYDKSWTDSSLQLTSGTDAAGGLVWTSSKPAVATVDSSGLVKAVSAGTTTVTASANDGSGKKQSVTIKVINPASGVSVVSSALPVADASMYQSYSYYNKITFPDHGDANQFHYVNEEYNFEPRFLAVGKSVSNTAVLGDAFGAPSVKKVAWTCDVYVYGGSYSRLTSVENTIINNKWITVNASGRVTVKNNATMRDYADSYYVFVFVNAHTTDNTYLAGSMRYMVINQVSSLVFRNGKTAYSLTLHSGNYENEYYIPVFQKFSGSSSLYYINPRFMGFTVTSSNPDVAGGAIEYDGSGHACVRVISGISGKTGSAKITITAADGSGKKCFVNVKVVR